jgi:UbiD family decarboxylase
MTGEEVDLTVFPAPKWHAGDGGRYIGTGSFNITRDPDEGWINCGTYRVMIHDAKTAGFYISPGKHGRQMRDKYQARGRRGLRRRSHDLPHGLERGALRRERI